MPRVLWVWCVFLVFGVLGARSAAASSCPPGQTLYGESVGGFCCTGTVTNQSCAGTVCALDPDRAQGNPMCPVCPNGSTLYGSAVGGFCCFGSTDGGACQGAVCALDPARAQGNPVCGSICPAGTDLYGLNAGGFCCDGTVSADGQTCKGSVCAMDRNRAQNSPPCANAPRTMESVTCTNGQSAMKALGACFECFKSGRDSRSWGYNPSWTGLHDVCYEDFVRTIDYTAPARTPAVRVGKSTGLACPSGGFYDPYDGGTCWRCDSPYVRSLDPVYSATACHAAECALYLDCDGEKVPMSTTERKLFSGNACTCP